MLDKYGQATVDACINELLDMADRHMRGLIKTVPDGTYEGVAILEDAGHGFGDFEITATVTIKRRQLPHRHLLARRRFPISSIPMRATRIRASISA